MPDVVFPFPFSVREVGCSDDVPTTHAIRSFHAWAALPLIDGSFSHNAVPAQPSLPNFISKVSIPLVAKYGFFLEFFVGFGVDLQMVPSRVKNSLHVW